MMEMKFLLKKFTKLYIDLNEAHKIKKSGKVSTRLNYAKNGFKSLIIRQEEN